MLYLKKLLKPTASRFRDYFTRDLMALQQLEPLSKTYVGWSLAALRPYDLVIVLNEIIFNNYQVVFECGAGISTVYIARLLKQRNAGHLYSIEHDEKWVEIIRAQLSLENLDTTATVIHAPLAAGTAETGGNRWYDTAQINPHVEGLRVDFLLVDGPLAGTENLKHARYPALPYFKRHFSQRYTAALDDISRPGEQEVLARWMSEFGVQVERVPDSRLALIRAPQ